MRKPKFLIYIISGLLLTASCSKSFIDIEPQQNTDANETIKDIAGMRAAVNGIYSLMQSANHYGRTSSLLPDLMSDNEYISVLNANRYQPQDQYITTANDGFTSSLWNSLYAMVVNANLLIQKGEPLALPVADTAEKRKILGEAYALRALAYFDLCKFFCQPYNNTPDASHYGVPLILTSSTSKDSVKAPSRSPLKAVYDQIIVDLNTAISNLSSSTSVTTRGHFNLYGAQGLLSRVYLYKEDWAKAIELSTAVINAGSSKYSLLPRASFVADFKKQGNAESILELVNTPTDNQGTDALGYFYNQSGYGDALATDNLYNAYKSTDVRRDFMTRGRRSGSGGENPANIINKYSNITSYEENLKLIRLAEMYLTRAEAYAHNGQEDLARTDANTIIARSDSDPTSLLTVAVTGNALITAILDERRKELAFEGHRLFDLTRNKLSFVKIRRGGSTINVTYPAEKAILPIPLREIDANPNIRGQQNPGYNN